MPKQLFWMFKGLFGVFKEFFLRPNNFCSGAWSGAKFLRVARSGARAKCSGARSGAKFLRIGRSGAEHEQSAPERGAEHFFLPSHSSAPHTENWGPPSNFFKLETSPMGVFGVAESQILH